MTLRATLFSLLLLFIIHPVAAQPADIGERVDALLDDMTLEQKVGEMTQLTLQAVSAQEGTATQDHELDMERLREVLTEDHVGSILNNYNVAFPPERWAEIITTIQDIATEREPSIPVLYGIDAVHGHNYMVGATLFPQNLGLGATWNRDLVRRAQEITAMETRATGIPWNFAPVLDVARQPLWSRTFEAFSEDPYLATVLGEAAVEGLQGDDVSAPDRVAATGKHFLGYSMPHSGKDRTPALIPERTLREIFLPPFQAAIDAGLKTIMVNSSEINGVPVHSSKRILTDLLREELGFEGLVVTDWQDVQKLQYEHRVAATHKEAVRMAVEAGIDMAMTPYSTDFHDLLVELVEEGTISEARIDESARRILRLKMELGLFEDPYPKTDRLTDAAMQEHDQVSRQAAEQSITLLQNDGTLPLADTANVLVTGPGAQNVPALHGGWTYTWQGTNEAMYPDDVPTILEAVRTELGTDRVSYHSGDAMQEAFTLNAAAQQADAVVLCLAERPSTEMPGDINDLTLPAQQLELARTMQATGTPVILVLVENRPRIIRPVADAMNAIVQAFQPGPHGGPAIARVLSGSVNPSGHLPITYPRHTGNLMTYDHKTNEADRYHPQFEFGHGLSYTTFAYRDLTVSDTTLADDETVTVEVTVENTGDRAGRDVVQLYTHDRVASVTPKVRELRGFQTVNLDAGEAQTVSFDVTHADFAFTGRTHQPTVEPGRVDLRIGDLMQTIRLE
jgi:beta-glucosidase